jgi:hypothetical protein
VTIEITVRDPETGETATRTITDDYVLICAGNRYLAHTQTYRSGTHQLTVKVDRDYYADTGTPLSEDVTDGGAGDE